jgi:hypothetical protein
MAENTGPRCHHVIAPVNATTGRADTIASRNRPDNYRSPSPEKPSLLSQFAADQLYSWSKDENHRRPRLFRSVSSFRLWLRPRRIPVPHGHVSLLALRFPMARRRTKPSNTRSSSTPIIDDRSSRRPRVPWDSLPKGRGPPLSTIE